jgi:hypothetical protein
VGTGPGDRELEAFALRTGGKGGGVRGPAGHVVVSCRAEGCRSVWHRPRCEGEGSDRFAIT